MRGRGRTGNGASLVDLVADLDVNKLLTILHRQHSVDVMETKITSHARLYAGNFAATSLASLRDELDPLARIQTLSSALANVESSLGCEMAAAQAAGLSWQQIGAALGITRQAAQQLSARLQMRYSR